MKTLIYVGANRGFGLYRLLQKRQFDVIYAFEPDPEMFGFRLDEPYAYPKDRLKFLSSTFGVSVLGATKNGKLSFKKIRLFGIAERSS